MICLKSKHQKRKYRSLGKVCFLSVVASKKERKRKGIRKVKHDLRDLAALES